MVSQHLQSGTNGRGTMLYRLQEFLSPRACSVIMLAALFCTLTVKLFHSLRYGLLTEYPDWVMSDLSVLITVEVVLSLVCFRWPKKNVVRLATVVAAVVCTWSVMNAGWLIRTGTQILPRVLLPLFRAPANSLFIVGVNLAKMPVAAVVLLAPSAVALIFFFFVLAKPRLPVFSRRWFCIRIVFSLAIVVIAVAVRPVFANRGSLQIGSAGLRYNSQLRAVVSLMLTDYRRPPNPKREIPSIRAAAIIIEVLISPDASG